jgi:glycine/D-amino acid oxidase-like deaminating enzyme
MDYRVDAVVVGAGVVGLAIARALALAGREVLVLERGNGIGQETSSRNSGVIHAGIYYPPDSLKALLCVRGRELLYAFARERGVAHARCGKLVVGSSAESGTLAAIAARAHRNFLDRKARIAQPARERRIPRRRPDRQHAAWRQRLARRVQPAHRIELGIGCPRQAVGAIVHIEQDRVIAAVPVLDQPHDIIFDQPHARIIEAPGR